MMARPALYNLSTFNKKGNLIEKHQVIKEYIKECVKWKPNPKNSKYLINEMMSNRRAPVDRHISLPQVYPGGQTIAMNCTCQTMGQLCKLWGVPMLSDEQSSEILVKNEEDFQRPTTEHRYEDEYFLEPEKYRHDQHIKKKEEAKSSQLSEEGTKEEENQPKTKRQKFGNK